MYNYTLCGLDNVWLENGYTLRDTAYGQAVHIDDPDGLDLTIGLSLATKPGELTGKELRFLRQNLGLSQKDVGRIVGVDAQTVARWEKGETGINAAADKLVRLCFMAHVAGDTMTRETVAAINFIDKAVNARIVLTHTRDWESRRETCPD